MANRLILVLTSIAVLGVRAWGEAQTLATAEIQKQIDVLTSERAQLLQIQKDCAPVAKAATLANLQAIIDKLTALKAEPQATPDIDALLDNLIVMFQRHKDRVTGLVPGVDCAKEPGAAARIGEINGQLPKLEALKVR